MAGVKRSTLDGEPQRARFGFQQPLVYIRVDNQPCGNQHVRLRRHGLVRGQGPVHRPLQLVSELPRPVEQFGGHVWREGDQVDGTFQNSACVLGKREAHAGTAAGSHAGRLELQAIAKAQPCGRVEAPRGAGLGIQFQRFEQAVPASAVVEAAGESGPKLGILHAAG